MSSWSVLVTAEQSEAQAPITGEQSQRLLDLLGTDDSWVQYPPASGRGHAFEVRWWQLGDDAAAVGSEAVERYEQATAAVGLEFGIVLVHVASAVDRLTEAVLGLERRAAGESTSESWNVMLRAVAPSEGAERRLSREMLDDLLASLPGAEASGFGRDGLVEVRFWVDAQDAADAVDRAAVVLQRSLAALGRRDWTIVRAHGTSVAEAARAGYLGVERRVLAADHGAMPIAIRTRADLAADRAARRGR